MKSRKAPQGDRPLRPIAKPPPGCPEDAIVLSFPVAREFSGMRLDIFIQGRIPRLSRTRAKEIVKAINLRGTTVLVATHDTALMTRFPQRQLRFKDTRLVAS